MQNSGINYIHLETPQAENDNYHCYNSTSNSNHEYVTWYFTPSQSAITDISGRCKKNHEKPNRQDLHYTHACTHARTHIRTHALTHARTHARTHAPTHTHTHTQRKYWNSRPQVVTRRHTHTSMGKSVNDIMRDVLSPGVEKVRLMYKILSYKI